MPLHSGAWSALLIGTARVSYSGAAEPHIRALLFQVSAATVGFIDCSTPRTSVLVLSLLAPQELLWCGVLALPQAYSHFYFRSSLVRFTGMPVLLACSCFSSSVESTQHPYTAFYVANFFFF